ncbi:hypothetical protein ACZ90_17540 [Streptomyces albus subsp. albus]|nr:hypothetical protein ACZ90_17540 [Streptomyces albus subsp. albus]
MLAGPGRGRLRRGGGGRLALRLLGVGSEDVAYGAFEVGERGGSGADGDGVELVELGERFGFGAAVVGDLA